MSDTPLSLLNRVFGYPAFRGEQAAIVDTVVAGGDALVLMPTGGGKSLCYQIPALLREGCAVVVSPLIALMQDQVAALRELGIAAAFLNSSLDGAAALHCLHDAQLVFGIHPRIDRDVADRAVERLGVRAGPHVEATVGLPGLVALADGELRKPAELPEVLHRVRVPSRSRAKRGSPRPFSQRGTLHSA